MIMPLDSREAVVGSESETGRALPVDRPTEVRFSARMARRAAENAGEAGEDRPRPWGCAPKARGGSAPSVHGTRSAFTLMEVALATLILVFSALVVLMLLPNALQVQKASRYKIVASLHAQNLMAHFYQSNLDTRGVQAFLPFKDDDLTDWRNIKWAGSSLGDQEEKGTYNLLKRNKLLSLAGEYDFERQIANAFNNTYPVPLSIARRLDSPNDEIKKILDSGGVIFYSDKLNSGINPNIASSSSVNGGSTERSTKGLAIRTASRGRPTRWRSRASR